MKADLQRMSRLRRQSRQTGCRAFKPGPEPCRFTDVDGSALRKMRKQDQQVVNSAKQKKV